MKLMGRKIGTHNKYINIIHKNTSANKLKRNRKFFSVVLLYMICLLTFSLYSDF